jgi:ankyrin repeat protein
MLRKQFFHQGILAGSGLIFTAFAPNGSGGIPQEDPQLDKKLVQEFVGAGHRDMEKVKALLQEHPTLLNSAHDWKLGDFETCLGAASHVGYKELATWLVEQGAQANIFTAALFGRMEILKPFLDYFPQALNAKGPHGYTLLHHAENGGDEALAVKEYLVALGAKETRIQLY